MDKQDNNTCIEQQLFILGQLVSQSYQDIRSAHKMIAEAEQRLVDLQAELVQLYISSCNQNN